MRIDTCFRDTLFDAAQTCTALLDENGTRTRSLCYTRRFVRQRAARAADRIPPQAL